MASAPSLKKAPTKSVPRRIVPVIPRSLDVRQRKVTNSGHAQKEVGHVPLLPQDAPSKDPETHAPTSKAAVVEKGETVAQEAVVVLEKEDAASNGNANGGPAVDTPAASKESDTQQTASASYGTTQAATNDTRATTAESPTAETLTDEPITRGKSTVETLTTGKSTAETLTGKATTTVKPTAETLTGKATTTGNSTAETLTDNAPSIRKSSAGTVTTQSKVTHDQVKNKVQLPPAFVPSSSLHNRLSSPNFGHHPIYDPHHHSHISSQDSIVLGGPALVFGGPPDSSGPSPNNASFQHPYAMPPPSYYPPGFGDHMAPENDFTAQQNPFPNGTHAFNMVAPASAIMQNLVAKHSNAPFNGGSEPSRTPSQTSSGASYNTHGHPGPHSHSTQPSTHASSDPHQPSILESNFQSMQRYLWQQFGKKEYADYFLDFPNEQQFPVNSLIISRSPGLRDMMNSTVDKVLTIPAAYYFRNRNAFIAALHYLYLGDLPTSQYLLKPPNPADGPVKDQLAARMEYVLSYAASGITMHISQIHSTGIDVVPHLLCWETIEVAIDFALNSRFSNHNAGKHLRCLVVDYVVNNFPRDFVLDTSAHQLQSVPRLPEQHRRRSLKIQFGDAAPVTKGPAIPYAHSVLSSVLISLPIEVLQDVFNIPQLAERLSCAVFAQHVYTVVNEREKRRIEAFEAYAGEVSGESLIAQNLFWEESVDRGPQYICGFGIQRRRIHLHPTE